MSKVLLLFPFCAERVLTTTLFHFFSITLTLIQLKTFLMIIFIREKSTQLYLQHTISVTVAIVSSCFTETQNLTPLPNKVTVTKRPKETL